MASIRSVIPALAMMAISLTACDRESGRGEAAPAPAPAAASPPAQTATGTVMETAARDPDFTTLVSAMQTAGMDAAMKGAGPYTIFAPTNAAFEKLPAARRDFLTTPEGLPELRRLLTYHVVPGRLDAAGLVQRIQAGGGSLALTTMQGGVLTARLRADGEIELTDAAGGISRVLEADMAASNGVIHAIDAVAAPG